MGRRRDDADVVILDDTRNKEIEPWRSWDCFVDGRYGLQNLGTDSGVTVAEDSVTFEGDRWNLPTNGAGVMTDGHTFGVHDWGTVPMTHLKTGFLAMEFGPRTANPLPTNRRLWSCKTGVGSSDPGYHIEMPSADGLVRMNAKDDTTNSTPLVDIGLDGFAEPTRVLFMFADFPFFGVINVFQMQIYTPTLKATSQLANNNPNVDIDLPTAGIDGMSWGCGLNSQTTGPAGGPNGANGFDTDDFEYIHLLGFGYTEGIFALWTNKKIGRLLRYYGIR